MLKDKSENGDRGRSVQLKRKELIKKRRSRKVIVWRRGETDGFKEDHKEKEPVGKQSGEGGEKEPRMKKKGGLVVRVSLMRHS